MWLWELTAHPIEQTFAVQEHMLKMVENTWPKREKVEKIFILHSADQIKKYMVAVDAVGIWEMRNT